MRDPRESGFAAFTRNSVEKTEPPASCAEGLKPGGPPGLDVSHDLKAFRTRFTKQTWPGETLTTRIVVTGKGQVEEGKRVSVDLTLSNQDGEVKLDGSAIVAAA